MHYYNKLLLLKLCRQQVPLSTPRSKCPSYHSVHCGACQIQIGKLIFQRLKPEDSMASKHRWLTLDCRMISSSLRGSAICYSNMSSNGSVGKSIKADDRLYTGWTDYEFGGWKAASVGEHIDQFKEQLATLSSLPSHQMPIHVNCHTGCDSFTQDQAQELFEEVLRIGRDLGIPISHETHRGRILGSPWMCLRMIEKFKDLRITLDISHWNVVAERLIPIDVLRPVFCRVDHVHARIGTHESPQVGDPRARYSTIFTEYHELVWKSIWQIGMASSKRVFTMTPEYGPAQDFYMPQLNLPGRDGITKQYVEQELANLIFNEQKKLKELFAECSI